MNNEKADNKYYVVASLSGGTCSADSFCYSWHLTRERAETKANKISERIRSDVEIAVAHAGKVLSRCCKSDMFTGMQREQVECAQ